MKITNVLVSQPAPAAADKSPFYEISQKGGIKFDFHPFIRTQGASLKEFMAQRVDILTHTAVIFTSRGTIDHFFRVCQEARVTIPESMKYFCNTEAVALYLQKHIVYRKRKIFFGTGTFLSLMELILKHTEENFLLTLAEPHNPELPDTMERLKLRFNRLILSRTVVNDLDAVKPADYNLALFYSPAEIAAMIGKFGAEGLPRIATFGEGTTRAALEAGLDVAFMAPTPSTPSMSKALELYLDKIKTGKSVEPVVLAANNQSEEFIKTQEAKALRRARVKKPAAPAKGPAKSTAAK